MYQDNKLNRPNVPISKEDGRNFHDVILTFFISLTALPTIYFFNSAFVLLDPSVRTFWMMIAGLFIFIAIVVICHFSFKTRDWMIFGFMLFTFTSVIDLSLSLEWIGIIDSVMTEYLKVGEPYLNSPWGSAISAFDGCGFLTMYLFLIYRFTNNKSWSSLGLYWFGGIFNSMIILIIGVFCGKHSPTFCTLLNIPYVFFPIAVLIRIIRSETKKRPDWSKRIKTNIFIKLYDFVLILSLMCSICIISAKTFRILGSEKPLIKKMVECEPSLLYSDPAPFSGIQVLYFFFYIVPMQLHTIYYLFHSEKPQILWESGIIQAGTMLQAQFSHIVQSLDTNTPLEFQSDWKNPIFWTTNLLILLVPHLLLLRLYLHKQINHLKKVN